MKIAIISAHTAAGWHTHANGEDIGAIKAEFKRILGAGALEINGRPADVIYLLDSTGNVRRKFLKAPREQAAIDAANGREAKRLAEQAARDEARRAQTDASAKARHVAAQAAKVIVDAVKGQGTPPAPADSADESTPDETDPAARFGGGAGKSRKTKPSAD